MLSQVGRYNKLISTFILLALFSSPASAEEASTWVAPNQWFVYTVIFTVLIGSLVTLLIIRSVLSKSKWSLADALSEEADVTAMYTDTDGVRKPTLDASGKPILITEMCASTSRMVALMGMIVILLMFLGFGSFALFSFANTGNMPSSIDKVINFLLAGLTLFAPYIANKFASIFESFVPKRS